MTYPSGGNNSAGSSAYEELGFVVGATREGENTLRYKETWLHAYAKPCAQALRSSKSSRKGEKHAGIMGAS